MFYLSNRKLKLLIIFLLLLIFSMFLGLFSVHAQVTTPQTASLGGYHTYTTTEDNYIKNVNLFNGYGQGYLVFTLFTEMTTYQNQYQVGRNVRQVSIEADNGNWFQCEIGNNGFYLDNSYYDSIISVKCPVNLGTLKQIKVSTTLDKPRVMEIFVQFSDYITFIPEDSSSIVSAIQSLQVQQQAIQQQQNDIKNNTQDIKDSINDSNIDSNNANSSASTWNSKNATNGTITNLLTLPITLLQAIVNGLQTSCSSFSLGSLFGTNITLPCINVGNLIGSGLWTTIDILFSGFMILAIAKKLIKIFNDFTNLKSNQIDELYGGGNK